MASIQITYDWGHFGFRPYSQGKQFISGRPDNAGGVSVRFHVTNNLKDIKSYTLYFTAYYGDGEVAECEIRHQSTRACATHDPLIASLLYSHDLIFKNAWYNPGIRDVFLSGVVINFSNGETYSQKFNKPAGSLSHRFEYYG